MNTMDDEEPAEEQHLQQQEQEINENFDHAYQEQNSLQVQVDNLDASFRSLSNRKLQNSAKTANERHDNLNSGQECKQMKFLRPGPIMTNTSQSYVAEDEDGHDEAAEEQQPRQ